MNEDTALTEEQLAKGIAPGAQAWTRLGGTWYREQGAWAALVYPAQDTFGLQWRIRVWLHEQGMSGPANELAESSIASFGTGCHDGQSLEMAKGTADRMLILREVPRQ